MGYRAPTVRALAALVLTLTAVTNVAGGNGAPPPAEETGKEPAAADAVTEKYDSNALVSRLRDTDAIASFTKLALKNQIDDRSTGFVASMPVTKRRR